jgi:hypothetical protein
MLLIDDDANLRFPKLRKGRSRSDEKSIILTFTYICPDFDWLVILSPVIVNLHPSEHTVIDFWMQSEPYSLAHRVTPEMVKDKNKWEPLVRPDRRSSTQIGTRVQMKAMSQAPKYAHVR